MNATTARDHAIRLAKTNPTNALEIARKINKPWFRAQALSWVARYADSNPITIAAEAARAAAECDDDYKRSSVRAWEIAALAERNFTEEAQIRLSEAVALAKSVQPASSRSEALFLLVQAAFGISSAEAARVFEILKTSCPSEEHWRCKRALLDGQKMISGERKPRPFFW